MSVPPDVAALGSLFLCAVSFVAFLGFSGPSFDRAEKAAAAKRAKDPPVIEVFLATDDKAAFPVWIIHDRATGRDTLAAKKGGQLVAIERPLTWTMPGDEAYPRSEDK